MIQNRLGFFALSAPLLLATASLGTLGCSDGLSSRTPCSNATAPCGSPAEVGGASTASAAGAGSASATGGASGAGGEMSSGGSAQRRWYSIRLSVRVNDNESVKYLTDASGKPVLDAGGQLQPSAATAR